MISNSDFEKLWFLYKTEGEPNQISINEFCLKQGVEYTKFFSCHKRTKKQTVPVKVEGMSTEEHKHDDPKIKMSTHKEAANSKGDIIVSRCVCKRL